MHIFHIWVNLKPGVMDTDFVDAVDEYLGPLAEAGKLENYRVTRRMLGLGHEDLRDFDIMVEFTSLEQFDRLFNTVAARTDPVESLHYAVNSKVTGFRSALYRDFPDASRQTGQEKF